MTQLVTLQFGKAEADLDALSCKVDYEYKALTEGHHTSAQVPSRVVGSVQGLRKDLEQLASEVEEIQKQQQEAMSTVGTQLKTLCSQFDDLSGIVGQHQQQGGEAAP
ncbi:hypothetical protein GWK47_055256 [Chionoecetes opilio]|uniref:Ska2 N-terminal domain-containing protein n=1 Tax=Chionoecetes opilio TaxID=41210 RepID=A0A8J4Y695_CHIOP|nr:hypothetical protein GWK47_055256 [Chionoecetes opilio]